MDKPEEYYVRMAVTLAKDALLRGRIPVASIIVHPSGLLSLGTNQRVQRDSVTRHAEIDAIENWGRRDLDKLREAKMICTLSPCEMCTGAILWSGIKTLVVADRTTFEGPTARLRDEGVHVCFVDDAEAYETMRVFRAENSSLWAEDNAGR